MIPKLFYSMAIAVILACAATIASAQDMIYLQDGTTIKAKVKEVNMRNIVYRKWENLEGADYVINRRDVEHITYENGTEEYMETGGHRGRPGSGRSAQEREVTMIPGYGKNIISVAPLQMTNESVAGVGIQYERMVDKKGIFSVYLPVALAFYSDYYGPGNERKSSTFTYLYPGLKIYPGGSAHRVSYSVGPSLGFGFGDKWTSNTTYDPGTGTPHTTYAQKSVFKSGFLVNNGLNIQPSKAFYIGLELGIGIFYANNEYTNFIVGDEPFVQFQFKMGYRF